MLLSSPLSTQLVHQEISQKLAENSDKLDQLSISSIHPEKMYTLRALQIILGSSRES